MSTVTKPIILDETGQDIVTALQSIANNTVKGVTFTPAVSNAGVISWTNDGNKQNPASVDLAGAVRSVIDETVSGTTPSITGVDNHRYHCGTVTSISITPPQTGIIDVIFTAGQSCTLTLPNTVKLPSTFDPTNLTEGGVYEINIADGIYGVVAEWT
jgi:hypothetical protein